VQPDLNVGVVWQGKVATETMRLGRRRHLAVSESIHLRLGIGGQLAGCSTARARSCGTSSATSAVNWRTRTPAEDRRRPPRTWWWLGWLVPSRRAPLSSPVSYCTASPTPWRRRRWMNGRTRAGNSTSSCYLSSAPTRNIGYIRTSRPSQREHGVYCVQI